MLLPKTVAKINRLGKEDQQAIYNFIETFRLSLSYSREFVDYLIDIFRRDGVAIAELVREIKIEASLPQAMKMDKLREVLRGRRYPLKPSPPSSPSPFGRGGNADAVSKGVRAAYQKGKWLKHCPGTKEHICCNYLVINNALGCPFNCTYCYLPTYINSGQPITIFTNTEALIKELKNFFTRETQTFFRIGTGEFSDSLALDQKTGLSKELIQLFAQQENHLLELKTKSANVDHLLDLEHRGKTVFAWSVNPAVIVQSDEGGTRNLEDRLAAAKRCVAAGYAVAFHFDPIIFYTGWEEGYQAVVDAIFAHVPADKIAWISLGALRYPPALKDLIEERFPHSRITLGDLDAGEDKKLRYFKPIRVELFQKLQSFIRAYSKEVYLYLCMESADVWRQVGLVNSLANPYAKYFKFGLVDSFEWRG